MRSTTRRILTATLGTVLLVTACSNGDDEAVPTTTDAPPTTTAAADTTATTTTTSTTVESTTTTPAPSTTTTSTTVAPTTPPTTSPPPTTNPGDPNWVEITQGLLSTLNDLRANPDADRIDEYCVAGENGCQSLHGTEVRKLVDEDWRVDGLADPVVATAELVEVASDLPEPARWHHVRVTTEPQDLTDAWIVDRSGATVFQLTRDPDAPPERLDLVLLMTPDGWRVLGSDSTPES